MTSSAPAQSVAPGWDFCEIEPLAALLLAEDGVAEEDGLIRADAQRMEATEAGVELYGDVRVSRDDLRLYAPQARVDRNTNDVTAEALSFVSPSMVVRSASGQYNLDSGQGRFEKADYFVAEQHARGQAEEILVDSENKRSQLKSLSYTTCPAERTFWRLDADELAIDVNEGRARARDVTFRLTDVPVAYLPYLSFPIDGERHSGFLPPRIGVDSDSGFDWRQPYYWNIAPHQDATLIPRILSRRGLMLGVQYRYLGERHRGEINAEYLPHDRREDDARGGVRVEHASAPFDHFTTSLLYQEVSDREYLDDFSNHLDLLSPDYLERRLDLRYERRWWDLAARVQDFQVLDEALYGTDDDPYSRLPQFLFNLRWPVDDQRINASLRAEAVEFDSDRREVTGRRFDLEPRVSMRFDAPWGFIEPELAYRQTLYQLDGLAPGLTDAPDRSLPRASVDSGLFFERPLTNRWLGDGILTLEPRFYYLYVPERGQDALPVFDTVELRPSLASLFRPERFVGGDRVGDANQLSLGLTSRFVGQNGDEKLRVGIGQAIYFSRPQVGLDEGPEDGSTSDFFAETKWAIHSNWWFGAGFQWDPDQSRTERSSIDLHYHDGPNQLINLAHRFDRGDVERIDLSFYWPIDKAWHTMGRWNYSLREDHVVDAYAGFRYDDCCWALSLLARHRRDKADAPDADNSVYVELELKGLGGLGANVERLLKDTLFGYESKE